MDPELAEWIVDEMERDDQADQADSFVDETETTRLLRSTLNAVRQLQTPILAPHMKRPPRVSPVLGPVPMWKHVQDARDKADVDDMLAYYGIE